MSEAHILVLGGDTIIAHHRISDGLTDGLPSELALAEYPVPLFTHDNHEHAGKVHVGDIQIAEGTTEMLTFENPTWNDIHILIAHTHEHPTTVK